MKEQERRRPAQEAGVKKAGKGQPIGKMPMGKEEARAVDVAELSLASGFAATPTTPRRRKEGGSLGGVDVTDRLSLSGSAATPTPPSRTTRPLAKE